MQLVIKLDMDNAAFEDSGCGSEVARILYKWIGRIEAYSQDDFAGETAILRDVNGNTVGSVEVQS